MGEGAVPQCFIDGILVLYSIVSVRSRRRQHFAALFEPLPSVLKPKSTVSYASKKSQREAGKVEPPIAM